MGFTPGLGLITIGEDTTAVTDNQGAALGGGHDPGRSADLQGPGGGATQDPGEPGQGGSQPRRQVRRLGPVANRRGRIPGPGCSGLPLAARAAGGRAKVMLVARVAADHDSGDGPITGQPPARLRGQRPRPAQLAPEAAWAALEAV
jgi:hypothetical protein